MKPSLPTNGPVFHNADHGAFLLESEQWVDAPRDHVFDFFSKPENLQRLTPDTLSFAITTKGPLDMREGLEIRYRLKVHGLPLTWVSLISTWDPPHSFTDTQLKGPYREWVHTHSFEEREGGTLIRDHVRYRVPGGRLVERLLVRRDLRKIFSHRRAVISDLF